MAHAGGLRARVAAAVGVAGALPRQAEGADEVEIAPADAICHAEPGHSLVRLLFGRLNSQVYLACNATMTEQDSMLVSTYAHNEVS